MAIKNDAKRFAQTTQNRRTLTRWLVQFVIDVEGFKFKV